MLNHRTPIRSVWRRLAVTGLFWLSLTALSVIAVAALGVMSAVIG